MKKILFLITLLSFIITSSLAISGGDFSWMNGFNVQAQADPLGFRARLATRFKINDTTVDAVISATKSAADAYMVLRCREISGYPIQHAINNYKSKRNSGWGVYAQSLGIKSGSQDFKNLKSGDDLYSGSKKTQGKKSSKGNGNGKSKGKK
ncbi:hypothetical protein [Desulfobacter curvatus]|uniref:hypothetical protein n=1 Tax=Desulfobacter curvatus TaxID=2290 RepID=UPI00036BD825|nr:hypothetical protein [Desulfobacter curvatus]